MASVGNIWINLKARTEEATSQMKSAFGQMGSMAIKFGSMFAGMSFLKGAVEQANTLNEQMNALSVLGLLSRFVGMLTDSRSFL